MHLEASKNRKIISLVSISFAWRSATRTVAMQGRYDAISSHPFLFTKCFSFCCCLLQYFQENKIEDYICVMSPTFHLIRKDFWTISYFHPRFLHRNHCCYFGGKVLKCEIFGKCIADEKKKAKSLFLREILRNSQCFKIKFLRFHIEVLSFCAYKFY